MFVRYEIIIEGMPQPEWPIYLPWGSFASIAILTWPE